MIGGFDGSPYFLLVFGNAISDGDTGLAQDLVQFQIVELEKNAELFRAGEFLTEARAYLVRVQDKLPGTSLGRGDFLDLVGEDQGAGIELVVFKMGDAKGGVEYPEIAINSVLDNEVKAIEAGAERNGFLVDGIEVQGRLKE